MYNIFHIELLNEKYRIHVSYKDHYLNPIEERYIRRLVEKCEELEERCRKPGWVLKRIKQRIEEYLEA